MRLADELSLTKPSGQVSAPLQADLAKHFDEEQFLELGVTLAVLTGMAKFLFAFDLLERESNCEFGRGGTGPR